MKKKSYYDNNKNKKLVIEIKNVAIKIKKKKLLISDWWLVKSDRWTKLVISGNNLKIEKKLVITYAWKKWYHL